MADKTISLCWLGIHNWSKWQDCANANCHMFQVKECECCGKKIYKELGVTRHDWTQWEDQGITSVMAHGGPKDIPIRRELVQLRSCKGCGTKDSRRIQV